MQKSDLQQECDRLGIKYQPNDTKDMLTDMINYHLSKLPSATKTEDGKIKVYYLKVDSIDFKGHRVTSLNIHERLAENMKEYGLGKYIGERYI